MLLLRDVRLLLFHVTILLTLFSVVNIELLVAKLAKLLELHVDLFDAAVAVFDVHARDGVKLLTMLL